MRSLSIINACQKEEESIINKVKIVSLNKFPKGTNIINSHAAYKLKNNDDDSLELMARTTPRGSKDVLKLEMKTTSATCPPTSILIFESILVRYGWPLYKGDVPAAFLQTDMVQGEFYVVLPLESKMRSECLWIFE